MGNALTHRCLTKVAGWAAQGRGHAQRGVPCQDRVYLRRYSNSESYVALSDGAGSCVAPEIGAEMCARTIGEIMCGRFAYYFRNPELFKRMALHNLLTSLTAIAEASGHELREYSATLIFVYTRNVGETIYYVAGHLGDGVVVMEDAGDIRVLSHPERGEFANSTYFVTSHDALKHFRVYTGKAKHSAGFLLASDGAAESIYLRGSKTLAPACRTLFDWMRMNSQSRVSWIIRKNLEQAIKSRTTDDCSISMIHIRHCKSLCRGERKTRILNRSNRLRQGFQDASRQKYRSVSAGGRRQHSKAPTRRLSGGEP